MIGLLVLGTASAYIVARDGIDVGRAIVDSRCSAGAFIAHSKTPSAVQADSHSDSAITATAAEGPATAGYAPVALTSDNLIANGNLEQRNGSVPQGWSSNATGANTSKFSSVAGDNSVNAVRIDITKYSDGTADWFGAPISVTPGGYYQFQDRYRSNVASRAVLQLKDNTGRSQYINLDSVHASDGWAGYTQRFFIPMNVSSIIISHPLDRVGWLETDNYSLQAAAPAGYDAGMISVTFDDGWRSIHDNALPLLNKYQIVSTQYLASGLLGSLKQYMTPGMVYDLVKSGHEIGSHSVDHPDLTKLGDKDLTRQLAVSRAGLDKCFQNVTDFAPPFGASSERTITAEKHYYATSRSTESGFNSPDTLNAYQLKVQNVRRDTPPSQMEAWIQTAEKNRIWLILVYHQVSDSPGEYSRQLVDFETDMVLVKNSHLENLTMHNAYVKSQNTELQQ
ncbi:MAG: hypothetical protein NVSMB39_1230 [Candidatus Saccharimonadales bacterium]